MRTIHLQLSDEEIEEIDQWSDQRGVRTRSGAIRQLIRQGLDSSNYQGAAEKRPASSFAASRYGSQESLDPEVLQQIKMYIREAVKDELAQANKKNSA